jgi:hypothetical protein
VKQALEVGPGRGESDFALVEVVVVVIAILCPHGR